MSPIKIKLEPEEREALEKTIFEQVDNLIFVMQDMMGQAHQLPSRTQFVHGALGRAIAELSKALAAYDAKQREETRRRRTAEFRDVEAELTLARQALAFEQEQRKEMVRELAFEREQRKLLADERSRATVERDVLAQNLGQPLKYHSPDELDGLAANHKEIVLTQRDKDRANTIAIKTLGSLFSERS
jgi:hypothetical protein